MPAELERITEREASNIARWIHFEHAYYRLGRHPSTLRRWIEQGRIRIARAGHHLFLRTLDVMRHVYTHPANREHVKGCMRKDKKVEIKSKNPVQKSNLNRPSNRANSCAEGPLTLQEWTERCELTVVLRFAFRRFAKILAPDDPSLRDDLMQEMFLAVLECRENGSRKFFKRRAYDRAIDYLKYERLRGFIPLDKVNEPQGVPRDIPDALLVQAMLEDGFALDLLEDILDAEIILEDSNPNAKAG